MPKIKFLSKEAAKRKKNASRAGPDASEAVALNDSESSASEEDEESEDESSDKKSEVKVNLKEDQTTPGKEKVRQTL